MAFRGASKMARGRRRNSDHPRDYVGPALGTLFMWLIPTITPSERYHVQDVILDKQLIEKGNLGN